MWELENSVVVPNGATVLTMTTDSLKIPYLNDVSHASTVFGGVLPAWTAEAAEKTATKPTFGQMEFTPHKLAGITYSSDELLADSAIALAQLITVLFGSAMGYFTDDAYLVGNGVGKPLGIQNCNATINNFRDTVNEVNLKDLGEMWMRLTPSSMGTAVWVINPTVLPELIELGSGNAADASGKNLVWINNAVDGPPMKIWGRPVIVSEKMQALGTAGDIGQHTGPGIEQSIPGNFLNSVKAKSNRYANTEPSPLWEGVETRQEASLWDEGIVQTTNTSH